jgi:hypothetical protein
MKNGGLKWLRVVACRMIDLVVCKVAESCVKLV